MPTLQEYEQQGGCNDCFFYVNAQGKKECFFHWFDKESEDWSHSKNCDELNTTH